MALTFKIEFEPATSIEFPIRIQVDHFDSDGSYSSQDVAYVTVEDAKKLRDDLLAVIRKSWGITNADLIRY